MKKITSLLLALVLVFSMCIPVFATEVVTDTDEATIVVDMNNIDVSQPYEITKEFVNDRGETVTLRAVYTPAEPTAVPMWSHSYEATVGTWTSYFDGSIIDGMSYQYDVSRSGTHWKISNARNHVAHCILSTIRDKSLTINRAVSTPTYPAEVMGMCTVEVIDTPIGNLMTVDAWIKTTISDSGVLTVSGN